MKNNMIIDLEKYKTQLCAYYEEKGQCPVSNQCKFAHGELELRSILNNKINLYLESSKTNNRLANSSTYMPKMKTLECKFFKKFGNCKYERLCHFAHGERDLKTIKSKENHSFIEKFEENINFPKIRKGLTEIKKLVEKGVINEASSELFKLYNKINFSNEDKILRINNIDTLDGLELYTCKQIPRESNICDDVSADQEQIRNEKFKLLESEIKIKNYNELYDFNKVSI